MESYITGFSRENLKKRAKDPYFEKQMKALKERAEKYLETEPRRIKFSDMHLFETTGNRSQYEGARGDYFGRASVFSLLYALEEDEKYIMPLCDAIWNICDLETWALPAHIKEEYTLQQRRCFLELVSTNTGKMFGEILTLVGEENLPEIIVRRMKSEVRERILESFKRRNGWWATATSNWAAVCICGVLGSYIYFGEKEELDELIPAMVKTAEGYLSGFDADGCCLEGYGYWSYGFSYFLEFADLLRNYTGGKINLFERERVKTVASFIENCSINDNQCVRFSDCTEFFRPSAPIAHFIKNEYPDIQIPAIPPSSYAASDIRAYIWADPALKDSSMNPKNKIFRDAQWFIYRSDAYNFVCKAGHNNEPHNHNDVGSFMISKGGAVTFTDPGTGEYTRQYFSTERYTVLEPSSRSHSVPIINGTYQICNKEKADIFVEKENEYAYSVEKAYDVPTLKSLKRHFVCNADNVTLTDSYEFSEMPESVVERFVSLVAPKIEDGKITVGESTLEYDASLFELEASTETCNRAGGVKETLYVFDLKPKTLCKNFSCSFKFV